jgi:hypothetical protein
MNKANPLSNTILAAYLILTLISTLSGGFLSIPITALALPYELAYDSPNTDAGTGVTLADFVHSISNGNPNQLVGVYVPGVMSMPVGQQPAGNAGYVTRENNQVTQFGLANQYNTVGILAHNDLAGALFSEIQTNQYAILVYGDGHLEYYVVNEIQMYQALSPTSTFSDFINLDGSQEHLSAGDLFNRVYAPGERLVFQTCIAAQGDPSWGRMFITATPATSQVLSVVEQTSRLLEFASFGLVAY